MSQPTAAPPSPPHEQPQPPLRRSRRGKLVAGVCGGLGRHCDVDPVIFRVSIGVLSATGGVGLIFYGFAWLLIPSDDDEDGENEFRRLLSGRVDRACLSALLLALIGCGLLLSMLRNADLLAFAAMLSLATAGLGVWSLRRRAGAPEGAPAAPSAAHTVAEAPPETKAPPSPDGPSWWRDPILKDGTTGPVATGYLWGPADAAALAPEEAAGVRGATPARQGSRRGIGGPVVLLALLAGAIGTAATWGGPLGTSLQTGLVAALAVLGAGLVVSSVLGRTGAGTVLLTAVTAGLLAGAAALPPGIDTDFREDTWRPSTVAGVRPSYELGSGSATLDLSGVDVPKGDTASTRAEVGLGVLRVVVPADAVVVLRATAGVGGVRLPDDPPDLVRVDPGRTVRETLRPPEGAAAAGTVRLELEVGIGQVEVDRAQP
ncbi:PspC domain-containing protein [Streptomyces sp. C10-9-1]|uniref:PspC domain-containing protein n=1 Tax=Streptomyces sp. C10-9-1 TaxID=1859285 RepID=UPI003F4A7079